VFPPRYFEAISIALTIAYLGRKGKGFFATDLNHVVISTKSEQILRVLVTFGGKSQQRAGGKHVIGLWSDLLLSLSTGFEQDPILRRRAGLAQF
jgi:hypothetical protein